MSDARPAPRGPLYWLARLRANRFGNAAFGAVLFTGIAIGVTQVMMLMGFG